VTVFRNTAVLILFALASFPLGALAEDVEGWRPSTSEAIVLPKFCWRQFLGDKFKGPPYEIPRELCGVGTNHYCPALVLLNRANKSSYDSGHRRGFLEGAKKKTLYTLKAIEKFPRCPLHREAESTYQIIERRLRELW